MLTVTIPSSNIPERTYSINAILKTFLGLDYKIEYTNTNDYNITLDNGKILTIKDAFFAKYTNEKEYLHVDNIPKYISKLQSSFHKNIVVLFGENRIERKKNETIVYADIFASTFFMLTRWEEHVNKTRDKHNRFPAHESVAFKNNFLDRPIVNEYVDLLWNMLVHLGYKGKRKEMSYKMIVTHDVDIPRLWWNNKSVIRTLIGDIIKRKSVVSFCKTIQTYLTKLITGKDPFDTFDYLMNLSEKNKIKSYFFFMSGGTSDKDNYYRIDHPEIVKLMDTIKNRGHFIGFHPSYHAYNNNDQFYKELETLNKFSPIKIKSGREHFLRFEIPTTWQIWEDHRLEWDSSMSYHDFAGFRCGVCYPFPVFNILTREQLNLIERPLIAMDGSFVTYQDVTPNQMLLSLIKLINTVKKHRGEFVLLWHNSAFHTKKWNQYKPVYETILKNYSSSET